MTDPVCNSLDGMCDIQYDELRKTLNEIAERIRALENRILR